MKAFKVIAGIVVATAAVMAVQTGSASATTSNKCDVKGTALGHWGETFVIEGNKVTSTFEVTGTACTTPVTLAVWESPADSVDTIKDTIATQKLFAHTTSTFGPGVHSLTVTAPDCFYQADLLLGDKATAPDGTAHYAYQNGEILKVHPLRDFKFAGDKKCEDTPEDPEDPKEEEKGHTKSTATTLTKTGPASVLGTFAGVSASGAIAHTIVSRKKRQ